MVGGDSWAATAISTCLLAGVTYYSVILHTTVSYNLLFFAEIKVE